ncbi:MAG: NAD(P)-dependent oxidoreductase [Lentisphaerae bacterium]|nr:NAD(P)-dependent oxidoreductase [Lentisphaerota bacterium]
MTATRIGWIGTGVMGGPMCGHLLAAGHPVTLFTRTRAKAGALVAQGAVWQTSPREVAAQSDVTFVMVGYPREVEDVILGPDGVLAGARPGTIVVDMSTSEPTLAERIHRRAAARGVRTLDAPVSGGDVGAREATLAIMVGGDAGAVAEVTPLLQRLGKTISHMGQAGAGQHAKLCNQILIASTMIGVVECLVYAVRAGLEAGTVIEVVGRGAAASWALNHLGPRIVRGDFAPGFSIQLLVKDMGIALAEAERRRLTLPGLALANRFYQEAMAQGLADQGTQALYRVVAKMNGLLP